MTRTDVPEAAPPSRFRRSAIVATTAVVVAGIAGQLVDYAVFDLRIEVLNSAADGGAFGVVGDLAAASAAAAAWLLAGRARRNRWVVLPLALLLSLLAIDKVLRLHDHVPHYLLFYAPALVATFGCLVVLLLRAPRPLARILAVGLLLLGVSLTLHVVGEALLSGLWPRHTEGVREAKAALKHGCEVEGWFLIAIGLTSSALDSPRAPGVAAGRGSRAGARRAG
jgi:hypothetical protein